MDLAPKAIPFHRSPPLRQAGLLFHGHICAHTVFCTKNILFILVAFAKPCIPLRSTKDRVLMWNKEHRPSPLHLPGDTTLSVYLCLVF